jgi:hypothetical protein
MQLQSDLQLLLTESLKASQARLHGQAGNVLKHMASQPWSYSMTAHGGSHNRIPPTLTQPCAQMIWLFPPHIHDMHDCSWWLCNTTASCRH